MKNFVVFANCQSRALALTLMEDSEFSSIYNWLKIPAVQNINADNIDLVLKSVCEADLLIYQPVSESHKRHSSLSSDNILKKVKPGGTALSFPSIYFDGYFPTLQSFKGKSSVLNLAHDYFIAYCFSIGLNVKETVSLIRSDNLFSKSLSNNLLNQSIDNLEIKENEANVDIRISGFIKENYKKYRLFNQFNHPKRPLFKYLADAIFKELGFVNSFVEDVGASHLDTIYVPTYKSIYKNLELEFKESEGLYICGNGTEVELDFVVNEFFKFYGNLNKKEILSHIDFEKPFIKDLF